MGAMWGCNADRSGLQIGAPATGNTKQATFCIPLLSGVVGTLSDKFLPIGLCNDDIRMEITWEAQGAAVCFGTSTSGSGTLTSGNNGYSWNIINVELECTIVELSDEGQAMVNEVTPFDQPIYLHGSSYRHYVSTLPSSSSGMYTTLVPARQSSLKALHLCPRRNTEISAYNAYSIGSRANPQFSSFWIRCGAFLLPQKPINIINSSTTGSFAESFAETIKAFHQLNSYIISTSVTSAYYNVNDAASPTSEGALYAALNTTVNSYQNAFAIGLELESFALRNDVLLSGLNSLSTQIFFECNMASTANTTAYTLDFYSYFDQILVLDSGILSVKF
jgi:hypothetical protein